MADRFPGFPSHPDHYALSMSMIEPPDPGDLEPGVTNRKAVYSLVCGILAFACIYVTPFLGLLVAIPSITSGIHARREIALSKGEQTGDSTAVIGLMVGGGAFATVTLAWLVSEIGSF